MVNMKTYDDLRKIMDKSTSSMKQMLSNETGEESEANAYEIMEANAAAMKLSIQIMDDCINTLNSIESKLNELLGIQSKD